MPLDLPVPQPTFFLLCKSERDGTNYFVETNLGTSREAVALDIACGDMSAPALAVFKQEGCHFTDFSGLVCDDVIKIVERNLRDGRNTFIPYFIKHVAPGEFERLQVYLSPEYDRRRQERLYAIEMREDLRRDEAA